MNRKRKIISGEATINSRMKELKELLLAITVGNYSMELEMPDEEDDFTELHYMVKIMYDTIKQKKQEIHALKIKLESLESKISGSLTEIELISQVGIWEWKIGDKTIQCSEQFSRLLGFYPAFKNEIPVWNIFRLIRHEELMEFRESWLIKNPEVYSLKRMVSIRTFSGVNKAMLLKGEATKDKQGNIEKFHGTLQDVSEILRSGNEALLGNNPDQPSMPVDISVKDFPLSSKIDFNSFIDSIQDGIIFTDTRKVVVFANRSVNEMTGYHPDELEGTPLALISGFYDEDEPSDDQKKHSEVSSRFEHEIIRKDGTAFCAMVRINPIKGKQDELIGHLYMFRNIDSRKKYEKKINSMANFSIENPNPTLRYSIDEQQFIFHNKASRHIMRYLTTKSNEEEMAAFKQKINAHFKGKKVVREEVRINKQIFLFTFVSIKEKRYVNLYGSDQTAVKKAESEVNKLHLILSKTDNGVIIADKRGHIQWVNEGFQKLTGYRLSEVRGTSGAILRKGRDTGLSRNNPYFKKLLQNLQSVSFESRNFKKDGSVYWVITTLTPVIDPEGRVESIIAVDVDISSKKKAEQQMVAAIQKAEEAVKAKQSFLANMSHEIRTPMNVIMGIIQLLRETPLTAEQVNYLNSMDFAGENLLSIVNDVLDLSKLESGKLSIEKQDFDIHVLIDELMRSIRHRAEEKSLRLSYDVASTVPGTIIGDPMRLNQILLNLLSNSIKFTNEGEIQLQVSAIDQEDSLRLSFQVKDTGIGIPVDKQKLIFEEFEQAHLGNKRKFGGTGLGLSIVKRIVELHEGKIELQSKVGKGTEITVTIPYEKSIGAKWPQTNESNEEDRQYLSGNKILLVEDNKLNQMIVMKFLEGLGITSITADNGVEALKILKNENFDAILMDIQMPEMDGYETTRQIRQSEEPEKKGLPIMAMTAHAFQSEAQKCIDVGMDEYVSKPLKKEILEKALLKILKNHRNGSGKNENNT